MNVEQNPSATPRNTPPPPHRGVDGAGGMSPKQERRATVRRTAPQGCRAGGAA